MAHPSRPPFDYSNYTAGVIPGLKWISSKKTFQIHHSSVNLLSDAMNPPPPTLAHTHTHKLHVKAVCRWSIIRQFSFIFVFLVWHCADQNRRQQTGVEAPLCTKPGEVAVPSQRQTPPRQSQPTPVEILLPVLRHNCAGFEALGVLVQYLVYSVSTTPLQKEAQLSVSQGCVS
jgi:hypothetical protein